MKKSILYALLIVTVAFGVYFIVNKDEHESSSPNENSSTAFDGKNSSFTIDGKQVTLVKGISEVEAAPGSASKIITKYFGNDKAGDLTGDGVPDTAFLVTQSTGGSGIFYYAVVAVKKKSPDRVRGSLFVPSYNSNCCCPRSSSSWVRT